MSNWYDQKCFAIVYCDDPTIYAGDARTVIANIRGARLAYEDMPTVYVNSGGELVRAEVTLEMGEYDFDDYALVTVKIDGCDIGGFTIDGRA
jgi:hypothetical protein